VKHSIQIGQVPRRWTTLPKRLTQGILGVGKQSPNFTLQISDNELRRTGHISTNQKKVVRVREELRSIKRQLIARLREGTAQNPRNPRVILVSSALPGEGKTFVALNLALSLALERNLEVTLIDGDVSSRGLSQRLGLLNSAGLLDALDSESPDLSGLAQDTNLTNFLVIPAGRARPDATELLGSKGMANLVESITSESPNRVIILDSGSLLNENAPAVLAAYAGQIVFVIGANETSRLQINEALSVLDGHVGPLESANLGLVLNMTYAA